MKETNLGVAPVAAGARFPASCRVEVDEPTMQVRILPVARTKPKGTAEERLGHSLVELRNGNRAARLTAARELGDMAFVEGIRFAEAVSPLIVTMKSDADATVRQEAAWSLWKIGDERAHRPLIAALVGDSSIRVREQAARALGLMGVRDAVPIMLDLLKLGKHLPARFRAALLSSLGFLADQGSLEMLLLSAEDADPQVRYESVQALGRFLVSFEGIVKEQIFRRLERYVHPKRERQAAIRQAAIKALRLSREERANAAVARAAVSDPDAATREVALESLPLWNSECSESALIEALADSNWAARKTAGRSLARFLSRHGLHDSTAACEALSRMIRMFPSCSRERRLAEEAQASL